MNKEKWIMALVLEVLSELFIAVQGKDEKNWFEPDKDEEDEDDDDNTKDHSNAVLIVGIVLGTLAGILVLTVILFLIIRKCKCKGLTDGTTDKNRHQSGPWHSALPENGNVGSPIRQNTTTGRHGTGTASAPYDSFNDPNYRSTTDFRASNSQTNRYDTLDNSGSRPSSRSRQAYNHQTYDSTVRDGRRHRSYDGAPSGVSGRTESGSRMDRALSASAPYDSDSGTGYTDPSDGVTSRRDTRNGRPNTRSGPNSRRHDNPEVGVSPPPYTPEDRSNMADVPRHTASPPTAVNSPTNTPKCPPPPYMAQPYDNTHSRTELPNRQTTENDDYLIPCVRPESPSSAPPPYSSGDYRHNDPVYDELLIYDNPGFVQSENVSQG